MQRAWSVVVCVLVGCSGSATGGEGSGGSAGVSGSGTSAGGAAGSSAGGAAGSSAGGAAGSSAGGAAGSSAGGGTSSQPASGKTPRCGEDCSNPHGCYPCSEGSKQTIDGTTRYCVSGCWDTAPPPDPSCTLYGRQYPPGGEARDVYDCNACTCYENASGADWGCTTKACSCEGLSGAQYVATSPDECAVIDYACPANTEGFGGDCGCGCRQDPRCAAVYDCSSGCERDVIEVFCPYSEIVE
ncbi:MAG: hypothetical protein KC766_33390 [Myxococcales bacterium]|nr:hypothetical protein [Myxococcales bacterium]